MEMKDAYLWYWVLLCYCVFRGYVFTLTVKIVMPGNWDTVIRPKKKKIRRFLAGYFLNPLPVSRYFFRKSSALFLQGGFSGVPRFFCKGRVVVGRSTG